MSAVPHFMADMEAIKRCRTCGKGVPANAEVCAWCQTPADREAPPA